MPSNVGDLRNLKSLSLDGDLISTIPKSLKALSALQWQGSPMLELPKNLSPFNLVKLNLGHSKIWERLWGCDVHGLSFTPLFTVKKKKEDNFHLRADSHPYMKQLIYVFMTLSFIFNSEQSMK